LQEIISNKAPINAAKLPKYNLRIWQKDQTKIVEKVNVSRRAARIDLPNKLSQKDKITVESGG
jgi:hypothetical protein